MSWEMIILKVQLVILYILDTGIRAGLVFFGLLLYVKYCNPYPT